MLCAGYLGIENLGVFYRQNIVLYFRGAEEGSIVQFEFFFTVLYAGWLVFGCG